MDLVVGFAGGLRSRWGSKRGQRIFRMGNVKVASILSLHLVRGV